MNIMSLTHTLKTAAGTCLMALGLIGAPFAQASVIVAGTRVIYNADANEVTLKLSNQGGTPALTQVWIDSGDAKAAPSSVSTPFTVTPPVSRIDPGKAQTLRIFETGQALPQDKESVFYLNVLEIPPKPTGEDASPNMLQLAFRTRIKLFYRPVALKDAASGAPKQLSWRWSHAGDKPGDKPAVSVSNPTPYYVTLASFEIVDPSGASQARSTDSDMVGPGETKSLPVTASVPRAGQVVRYRSINDYGGEDEGKAAIQLP